MGGAGSDTIDGGFGTLLMVAITLWVAQVAIP